MITPEVLTRYAQKKCTVAEQAAVEQWFAGNTEVPDLALTDYNHAAKHEMWDNIHAATIAKDNKRKNIMRVLYRATYPIAACLLLLSVFWLQQNIRGFNHLTSINNEHGITVKKATIGNFVFMVEPGSRCDIATPLWGGESNVRFCGAVSVANTSGQSSALRINTGLSTCKMAYADEVTLRKGQTYLAMTDDYYNVITATTDELGDGLPLPFSTRLQKRFNL